MIIKNLTYIWEYIENHQKRRIYILVFLTITASLFDVISIGAVGPLLAILINPDALLDNIYIKPIVSILGIQGPSDLMLFATLVFIFTVFLAYISRFVILWMQIRTGNSIASDLSIQIYRKTLYQPYETHLNRNTSQIISGVVSKVDGAVHGVLLPLLTVCGSLTTLAFILGIFVFVNKTISLAVIFFLGSLYFLIVLRTKKHLYKNSLSINLQSTRQTMILQEGLGGIRDILLDSSQELYIKKYKDCELERRWAMGNNDLLKSLPRIAVEAVAIIFIVSLAYVLTIDAGNLITLIPILGTFAIGSQRLMPIVNQFYMAWSSIKGSEAILTDVLLLLEQKLPKKDVQVHREALKFEHSISLVNVSFQYSNSGSWVLKNADLHITKGSKVGIVGSTGSGKSTLIDILLGFLEPQTGLFRIDDVLIDKNNNSKWQELIAHVPQFIFLSDSSIAENIAFGVPVDKIDYARIKYAAKKAQIDFFIESCTHGYETRIGERGIYLSGGQRQRIGIARAFYKNAKVIIFDEATNALDANTEELIIDTINEIAKDITVIIVAHQIDTLNICDLIYEVNSGKIEKKGNYNVN